MAANFRVSFLIGLLACAIAGFAYAQQPEQEFALNPEDVKHGAVLCSWGILLGVREFGDKCDPEKDVRFQAALDDAIARIDQFIIDNAPMTREKVEQYKQSLLRVPRDKLCKTPDLRQLYELERKAGPEDIARNVTDLLSVPRKPVANPCL
jgi:hypothetical protein